MTDTKISQELAADPLDGSELTEVVQSGNNRNTTTQDIANLTLPVTISGHVLAPGASLVLVAGDIAGLAPSATTDTTNASNITSGTLPNARLSAVPNSALANSSFTVAGHTVSLGGSQNLAASDISGLAPVATSGSASDLTTGTLPNARLSAVPNSALANSSFTVAGHTVSLGGATSLQASDLTNGVSGTGEIVLQTSPTVDQSLFVQGGINNSGNTFTINNRTRDDAQLAVNIEASSSSGDFTIGTDGTVTIGGSAFAPTAAVGTNSTFLATTAFVQANQLGINVKAFGAVGDGSTDDASAINAAISSLASGGIVFFPPGVYIVGSSIILPSNIILVGSGRGATILRAKPSTSVAIVETANFGSLSGTNSTDGSYKFGLRSLAIDGNKGNGSTGNGLTVYGFDFNLDDIEIYNCSNICLYSEWSNSGTVPTSDGDSMESHIHGLKTWGAGVDGIQWFGPHDSTFDDVQTFINGRYGLYTQNSFSGSPQYAGGGMEFINFHSYGNTSHGVYCDSNIFCVGFQSESNGGDGIVVADSSFANFTGQGVLLYNNTGNGFNLTTTYATLAGVQAFANSGHGIISNGVLTASDVLCYSNGQIGVYCQSNAYTLSAVTCHDNASHGVQLDVGGTISGAFVFTNGGNGIVLNHADITAHAVNAQQNTGTGIQLVGSIASIVLSGKAVGNATQLDLGSVQAPSIVDVSVFNAVSQTGYTGTPGDVFLRIATAGTGAGSPINQAQT